MAFVAKCEIKRVVFWLLQLVLKVIASRAWKRWGSFWKVFFIGYKDVFCIWVWVVVSFSERADRLTPGWPGLLFRGVLFRLVLFFCFFVLRAREEEYSTGRDRQQRET